ncbi:hypothetical protein TcasGA2_TC001974 [Tribolium castaneum]|uniref:Uncharacterized protein n=1 Tax=Tribolium castaneum TaxID=7070 RepID=D7EK52_TRICA|nr:hypothetical protein TcasGA2_TC001974 [Tribolium castaneum]
MSETKNLYIRDPCCGRAALFACVYCSFIRISACPSVHSVEDKGIIPAGLKLVNGAFNFGKHFVSSIIKSIGDTRFIVSEDINRNLSKGSI